MLLPVVVHDLDVVAVGVEQEASVVVGALLGAGTRRSVAGVSGVHAGLPEQVDPIVIGRREADVETARGRVL
jgi:hypothetical protein